MTNWQKFLAIPITVAAISIFASNFIRNPRCDCELSKNSADLIENEKVQSEFVEFLRKIESNLKEIESNMKKISMSDSKSESLNKIESNLKEIDSKSENSSKIEPNSKICGQKPKFWFHIYNNNYKAFDTIKSVLNYLDFEEIQMKNESMHLDWDLFWSYQLHDIFKLPIDWSQMKYHQKINHIPGNHFLASKSFFGVTTKSKYVPAAFTDMNKLRNFAKNHPEKLFVSKLRSNRGVRLKNVSEMNFNTDDDLNGHFAQEFISNPLLFNGHKFDFGIYVLVTSVDPLRIYYYTKNMIFRFCPKTYNISDPNDTDRYVVSDTKTPVWEFPGTREYFELGYNTRDAFEGFLKRTGADVANIWFQIEDAIRSVVVLKEKKFIHNINKLGTSKLNHFELFRFDMILDSDFNLKIIEINQHPNLYPSARFAPNKVLYENLLYNVFNLIGVGTPYRKSSMLLPNMEVEKMIAHPHSMTVRPEFCVTGYCQHNCDKFCDLCWNCLSTTTKYDFLQAYREQMNAGDFKRLFPPEQKFMKLVDSIYREQISNETKIHAKWFNEMCKKNPKFC